MKQRNNKVTVRLTNSEKLNLEKQAHAAGLPMETFIRSLIAQSDIKERPPEYWREVVKQLSAIGNNINQIAHVANASYSVTGAELEEILGLMRKVWEVIKEV